MSYTNKYIEPILMKKKKHDFKAWLKLRKIIKIINKTSPSFYEMLEIYEFLSFIKDCYMYSNNDKFHLFVGAVDAKVKNAVAMIYQETHFEIKFLLIQSSSTSDPRNQISIGITRIGRNKKEFETITFYDGEFQIENKYQEEKMLFITSCLMNGLKELIIFYYKNKRF